MLEFEMPLLAIPETKTAGPLCFTSRHMYVELPNYPELSLFS